MATWTFLTNHGHTLLFVARHPDARLRDIASAVGITERAAQRIVGELCTAGYLSRRRVGRRNEYSLNREMPFRHPLEGGHRVGELVDALETTRAEERPRTGDEALPPVERDALPAAAGPAPAAGAAPASRRKRTTVS